MLPSVTPLAREAGGSSSDADGDTITAGRGRLPHVLNPLQAEVVACLQGVQAAIDFGISRIELETDALHVQQMFESKCWELSVMGSLFSELK